MILGYDLRLKRDFYFEAWKIQNSGLSLSEGTLPMSVDNIIWPSLFIYEENEDLGLNQFNGKVENSGPEIFVSKGDPITFNNEANRLWSSWQSMLNFANSKNSDYKKYSKFICFQLSNNFTPNNNWYIEPCESLPLAEFDKSLLGYEVCDSTLLTCHKKFLRKIASVDIAKLNSNFLFKNQSDAEEFLASLKNDASYLSPATINLLEIKWF